MSEVERDLPEFAEPLHIDRWEAGWIRISVIFLTVFGVAIIGSSFAYGIQLPTAYERINPNTLLDPEVSRFAEPGLRELAPGKYEADVLAQVWSFIPQEIRVPKGSTVTFYVTSLDVQHGFKIAKTNVNMMILPGQVSKLTAHFDEPGTYNIICHEYCGMKHHEMYGWITVE